MSDNRNIMISSDKFSESINEYEEKINKVADILDDISNIMKEIDGKNDTWRSKTSAAVHEEFVDIETNFEKINEELNSYNDFLKNTFDEYSSEENKQEKAIEENVEDLDIN